mgnify:CR=1 FL=1
MNPLLSIKGTIISGFVLAIVLVMVLADGTIPLEAEGYIRWLHYLSGVTWIGLLYYFNFVQVPAMAKATALIWSAITRCAMSVASSAPYLIPEIPATLSMSGVKTSVS